jgi:hypothetical protein
MSRIVMVVLIYHHYKLIEVFKFGNFPWDRTIIFLGVFALKSLKRSVIIDYLAFLSIHFSSLHKEDQFFQK